MDDDKAKDVSGVAAGAHGGIGLQSKGLSVLSIDGSIVSMYPIAAELAIQEPPLHLMWLHGSHFKHFLK